MNAAEVAGKELLDQVEHGNLAEQLSLLRHLARRNEPCLPFSPISDLVGHSTSHYLQLNDFDTPSSLFSFIRNNPNSISAYPLLELTSPPDAGPGAGKTTVLTLLIAAYISPPSNGAVILLDNDGRFSTPHLFAQVVEMLRHTEWQPPHHQPGDQNPSEEEIQIKAKTLLSRVAIIRPRSAREFCAALDDLLQSVSSLLTRNVCALCIDGLGAFNWEIRASRALQLQHRFTIDEDNDETVHVEQDKAYEMGGNDNANDDHEIETNRNVTSDQNTLKGLERSPDESGTDKHSNKTIEHVSFDQMIASLKKAGSKLGCSIIVTTLGSTSDSDNVVKTRESMKTLAGSQVLCVEKVGVRKFPADVTFEYAVARREERYHAVQNAGFRIEGENGEWKFNLSSEGIVSLQMS